MKKLVIITFLLYIGFVAKSQIINELIRNDTILHKTSAIIICNVTEVGTTEIKYMMPGKTPTYAVLISDVSSISYANGTKDIFPLYPVLGLNAAVLYARGLHDGTLYYPAKRCGALGTTFTTAICGPVTGLIPAIACAKVPPEYYKLYIREHRTEIADDENYIMGYTAAAHEIKRKKIWQAYTVASAGWVVAAVVVSVVVVD